MCKRQALCLFRVPSGYHFCLKLQMLRIILVPGGRSQRFVKVQWACCSRQSQSPLTPPIRNIKMAASSALCSFAASIPPSPVSALSSIGNASQKLVSAQCASRSPSTLPKGTTGPATSARGTRTFEDEKSDCVNRYESPYEVCVRVCTITKTKYEGGVAADTEVEPRKEHQFGRQRRRHGAEAESYSQFTEKYPWILLISPLTVAA